MIMTYAYDFHHTGIFPAKTAAYKYNLCHTFLHFSDPQRSLIEDLSVVKEANEKLGVIWKLLDSMF